MPSSPYPVPERSRILTALPDLVWVELTGSLPARLAPIKMSLLLALTLAVLVWRPLRPTEQLLHCTVCVLRSG